MSLINPCVLFHYDWMSPSPLTLHLFSLVYMFPIYIYESFPVFFNRKASRGFQKYIFLTLRTTLSRKVNKRIGWNVMHGLCTVVNNERFSAVIARVSQVKTRHHHLYFVLINKVVQKLGKKSRTNTRVHE